MTSELALRKIGKFQASTNLLPQIAMLSFTDGYPLGAEKIYVLHLHRVGNSLWKHTEYAGEFAAPEGNLHRVQLQIPEVETDSV